jgi:zinc D-Ala-D-Ala carboxypeptidase
MKKPVSLFLALILTACCLPVLSEAVTAADGAVTAPEWTFTVSVTELESDLALLVNRDHLLAADYVPEGLVQASVKCASSSKIEVLSEVNDALAKMFEDAALVTEYVYLIKNSAGDWVQKTFSDSDGLRLILKSGYRSYGTQKTTYNNYLARNNGVDDGISSPPGASEHQTGMAVDVLSVEYNAGNQYMNDSFYQTPEAQWMAENCYAYGFILRYPEDQEAVTQVPYEPWHLRYVGREIAGYIRNSGLTLEAFTDVWQAEIEAFVAAGGNVEQQLLLEAAHRANGIESTVLDEYGEDGDAEIPLSF